MFDRWIAPRRVDPAVAASRSRVRGVAPRVRGVCSSRPRGSRFARVVARRDVVGRRRASRPPFRRVRILASWLAAEALARSPIRM
jgi:hypothetical protein